MSRNEKEDDEKEHNKNPFGFNSTEIIAALSIELMRANEHIHNPITNKPFGIKIGKKYNKLIYLEPILKTRFSLRFSFGYSRRGSYWYKKLSILSIW